MVMMDRQCCLDLWALFECGACLLPIRTLGMSSLALPPMLFIPEGLPAYCVLTVPVQAFYDNYWTLHDGRYEHLSCRV